MKSLVFDRARISLERGNREPALRQSWTRVKDRLRLIFMSFFYRRKNSTKKTTIANNYRIHKKMTRKSIVIWALFPATLQQTNQVQNFVYLKSSIGCVCLLIRTGTKSIRLLVCMGLDRSIVGPGDNRLLRTGPFLMWFIAELSNSGSTMWYWNGLIYLFTVDRFVPK
jgi:hypothetical protein